MLNMFKKFFVAVFYINVSIFIPVQGVDIVTLPSDLRIAVMHYYNKKYHCNIQIPAIGPNRGKDHFLFENNFWYLFKRSVVFNSSEDARIMWFVGTDGGHATPVFYIKEGGRHAILIADSLGFYDFSGLCESAMYKELDIPIFIIDRPRQKDRSSCFLDTLLWGKMLTGKVSSGAYRIPHILDFLYDHSEILTFEHDSAPVVNKSVASLYRVKRLPATLLVSAQDVDFIKYYKDEQDNYYITSSGIYASWNYFLEKNADFFALDYLRNKGLTIYQNYNKYFSWCQLCKVYFNRAKSSLESDLNTTILAIHQKTSYSLTKEQLVFLTGLFIYAGVKVCFAIESSYDFLMKK